MSESFTDLSRAGHGEELVWPTTYFWEDPEAQTANAPDVDDLEELLCETFGIEEVWDEARQGITVYGVQCPANNLPAVQALIREQGFWCYSPSRRTLVSAKISWLHTLVQFP